VIDLKCLSSWMNGSSLHYYFYALCATFIRLIKVNLISYLYHEVEIFNLITIDECRNFT